MIKVLRDWVIIVCAVITLVMVILKVTTPNVAVGQIWVYTINSDNPFEPPMFHTNTIVAKTNGWVKYIQVRKLSSSDIVVTNTESDKIRWFVYDSTRIK